MLVLKLSWKQILIGFYKYTLGILKIIDFLQNYNFGTSKKDILCIEIEIALHFVHYNECHSNPPFLLCNSIK